MLRLTYVPLPMGIDHDWSSALDVFKHLHSSESERQRLCEAISKIHPNEPYSVQIWHPQSPGTLQISNIDTEEAIMIRISACIQHEFMRQYDYRRQGLIPSTLPNHTWPSRSLGYPQFRPPITPLSAIPKDCPPPTDDRIYDRKLKRPRIKAITLKNRGTVVLRNSQEVYRYLLVNSSLRKNLLQQAQHIRGDTFRAVAIVHEYLEAPIILRHSVNDQELCKILDSRFKALA